MKDWELHNLNQCIWARRVLRQELVLCTKESHSCTLKVDSIWLIKFDETIRHPIKIKPIKNKSSDAPQKNIISEKCENKCAELLVKAHRKHKWTLFGVGSISVKPLADFQIFIIFSRWRLSPLSLVKTKNIFLTDLKSYCILCPHNFKRSYLCEFKSQKHV